MDIDTLSHSNALHDKILQLLNLKGLCKYDSLCKAYIFELSNIPVDCSHILIFLNSSAHYTITPHTDQWYRLSTHEFMDSHNITICNENSQHGTVTISLTK